MDWPAWRLTLAGASVSYVLARGASFAFAHEIALKLAETAALPSLAYSTADTMRDFYRQSIENALAFLDGKPVRVLEPKP